MYEDKNCQSHYSKDGLLLSAGIRHITATQAEVKDVPACELWRESARGLSRNR